MAGTLTVELHDLHFFARQGLYEEELLVENELILDVVITFKAPEETLQHIHQTVNYAAVYQIIKEELAVRKDLLETCAMLISDRISHEFSFIEEVYIRIIKAHPPIVNFTGSVGVSYTKRLN